MNIKHYAVLANEPRRTHGHEIPASCYQAGHLVTTEHGTFRILGPAHHEQYGARGASLDIRWLAERVDASEIDPALTRDTQD